MYFYQGGFLHAKTLVADDIVSTVGSTNLDYRSFEFNFEVNAFIYNKDFGKQMKEVFLNDIEQCRLIDPEEWKNRPKMVRWSESICRLIGPLL